jgi:hypothetical protein
MSMQINDIPWIFIFTLKNNILFILEIYDLI